MFQGKHHEYILYLYFNKYFKVAVTPNRDIHLGNYFVSFLSQKPHKTQTKQKNSD